MDPSSHLHRGRRRAVLGVAFLGALLLVPIAALSAGVSVSSAFPPSPHASSGSASSPAPASVVLGPLHPPRIPARPAIGAAVNPNAYYSAEPAPMGITDFGIGPSSTPYTYHSSAFYGNLYFHKLTVDNSVIGSTSLTVQLNIVLTFTLGGASYAYWIQDVAFLDTSSKNLWFENNIWNFSSSGALIPSSTVSGNGSIYSGEVYIAGASTALPGNDITITTPYQIGLLCWAKVVNNKPEVVFQYRDTGGWVTYDNPIFTFASGASNVNFTVDGTGYNGYGLFNDAELILGGPGGGENTTATAANATMSLSYYNGRNFQSVPNAYDFGSDTAEAINGLTTAYSSGPTNGSLADSLGHGSGTLKQLYTSNNVATVSVRTRALSGTLAINGTAPIAFAGSPINVTIGPGTYNFSLAVLGSQVGSQKASVAAGSVNVLYIDNGSVYALTFSETGLPVGHAWGVRLGPSSLATSGTSLSLTAPNGTYLWHLTGTPGFHGTPTSGTVTIAGSNRSVAVVFAAVLYTILATETGLASGTTWSVTLNGSTSSGATSTIPFLEANGSLAFTVGTVAGYFANRTGGTLKVEGVNGTLAVKFTPNPSEVNQELAKSVQVVALGSVGASSLSAVRLANGTFELVLFNAKTNHTKVVGFVTGGGTIATDDLTAADGAFFVGISHAGAPETFELVNVSGKVTPVSLPLATTIPWLFAHGSTADLYAASGGYLVEVNPSTQAVVANYSSLLPSTLWVHAVLLSGQRLFVAGSLEAPNGTSAAYFGVINFAANSLRNISRIHYGPVGDSASFDSLAAVGEYVYVAGGSEQINTGAGTLSTLGGLFFRYYTFDNSYSNLTAELPAGHDVVWALAPWLGGLLLTTEDASGSIAHPSISGAILAVGAAGGKLVNDSAYLPSGFVLSGDGVTSSSGGYVFLGGSNPSAGLAEVVGLST